MKIIFIINAAHSTPCIKRFEEFAAKGYNIEAYAFSRGIEKQYIQMDFKFKIIGEYSNSTPFRKRIPILFNGISSILNLYKNQSDIIYYLFQLDIALAFNTLYPFSKYIYEEYDLMHTYIKNQPVKCILELLDKLIIRKSILSAFTSEGFIKYHFGDYKIHNTILIPNRLNKDILKLPYKTKEHICMRNIKIGFVGGARFKSIYHFADSFCKNFPEFEFHFFGFIAKESDFHTLNKHSNCYFHGAFKNPDDLPSIYGQIDLVLSTYDVEFENVRYAEPNKLYEAIYFEVPIIVSKGTFLEQKISKLGIGYSIDPLNESDITQFVRNLSYDSICEKKKNCSLINKMDCININEHLFSKLKSLNI